MSGFRSLESREEGFSESYETKQGNLKNSYSREMSDQASSRAFSRPKLQVLHPGIGCAFASGDTSKSQVRFDLDTSRVKWEKLWRHGKIKYPPQRFAAPSGFVGDGRQNLKGSLKLRRKESGAKI